MSSLDSSNERTGDQGKSIVYMSRRGVTGRRGGRGYSKLEIAKAFANIGLGNQNISKVRAFGIPVDNLRRSIHQDNVNRLEKVLSTNFKSKKNKEQRQMTD